jgi:hypothetical protein
MAKPKLILTASPTFKSRVDIPVPGGRPVSVEFTFKHRDADAYKEFVDTIAGRDEIDVIMDIATGWELEDAFDRESVEQLCKNYMGSGRAIFDKYIEENTGAKLGN